MLGWKLPELEVEEFPDPPLEVESSSETPSLISRTVLRRFFSSSTRESLPAFCSMSLPSLLILIWKSSIH